jgi:hypothetical protein
MMIHFTHEGIAIILHIFYSKLNYELGQNAMLTMEEIMKMLHIRIHI